MASGRRSIFVGADHSDPTTQRTMQFFASERFTERPNEEALAQLEELVTAVEANDIPKVNILCRRKELLNMKHPEKDGNTALHIAAENDFVDIVKILIEAGADPDALNDFGLTPVALCDVASDSCKILNELAPTKRRREALGGNNDAGGYGEDPFKGF